MHKTRRKRILLFLLCFFILVLVPGYIFRYPLLLKFQYARLRSLTCNGSVAKTSCPNKVWVHRVNSVERYQLLKDKFDGFESDIAYDPVTHSFFVYHPPLTGQTDTLSLSRLLKTADLSTKYFWLDTRDVYASNMYEALRAMSALGDSAEIRRAFVIELYDLEAAKLFAQNGYSVSFKLSEQLLQQLSGNQSLQDSIRSELKNVRYVSQEYQYLPAIKKLFPGKPIIIWDTRFSVFFDRKELQELLLDPQVEIVLVNIKSRYYK